MTARPVRTPSGVMRFRHRASVSQSSLPQPKRTSKLELESLKSLSAVPAESASRQSRELEALLAKLNGHDSSCEADVVDAPAEGLASLTSLDVDLDEDLGAMDSLVSVDSMNDALSGDASYVGDESLDESFFLRTGGQTDVSGPVPMGSGTFSRAPSGGFMLVLESMRSAVRRAVDRPCTGAARPAEGGQRCDPSDKLRYQDPRANHPRAGRRRLAGECRAAENGERSACRCRKPHAPAAACRGQ